MSDGVSASPEDVERSAAASLARVLGQGGQQSSAILMMNAAEEIRRLREALGGKHRRQEAAEARVRGLWRIIGQDPDRLVAVLLEIEYGAPQLLKKVIG